MSTCLALVSLLVSCGTEPGPFHERARDGLPPLADEWVAEDKFRHGALSFSATAFLYGGGRMFMEPEPAQLVAVGGALALGVGKELLDRRTGGVFSTRDLVWDLLGVGAGLLLIRRMN